MSLPATLFPLARPLLRALGPEAAHALTLRALRALPSRAPAPDDPRLAVRAFGLAFPNPVGLAAGFDKGAEALGALLALGFGHVEAGGVTPLPQPGNPRPRAFRLEADRAIINRYGLNSEGAEAVAARLAAPRAGIVGVNLGANKDSADRAGDYARLVARLARSADYLTINVSSPNTPGLRDLQARAALDDLLARALEARDRALDGTGRRCPVLVKLSPDLDEGALDDAVDAALARGADGLVATNTTLARPTSLSERAKAGEAGGLSGPPLRAAATRALARAYLRAGGRLPLVGVGGVDSPAAALEKIEAGASLVQLYTGLVYEGPGLVGAIKRGLIARMEAEGLASLAPLVGRRAGDLAEGPAA